MKRSKKTLALVLALAILTALCACSYSSTVASSETPAPVWVKDYYLDAFKTPTEDYFLGTSARVEGSYNSGSVSEGELTAELRVDAERICIYLFEDGTNQVKNAGHDDIFCPVSVKNGDGGVIHAEGILPSGGDCVVIPENQTQILLSSGDSSAKENSIASALCAEGGEVSFFITRDDQPATNYLFYVNCGNFSELYDAEIALPIQTQAYAIAPIIFADSDVLKLSVDATEEDLLRGMTAQDNLDGDVTDSLVVVSMSEFIAKSTRNVNYAAFDGNNNVGTYTRKLVYTDYHSPRFVIWEPMRFVAGNSSYDYLHGVRALDCLDGNITSQIKITFGEMETESESVSKQKVIIQVTNSAGDTSVLALTASYEDFDSYCVASPGLSDYVIYILAGKKPDYRVYLDGIWFGGYTRRFSDLGFNPDRDIEIDDSQVDYDTPGVYLVIYHLSRETETLNGSTFRTNFGSANLIVVVEDVTTDTLIEPRPSQIPVAR